MSKEKQIQIPQALFTEIMAYFLLNRTDLDKSIKKGLEEKLDAIVKHELYTKYKTAGTPEQQEQARKEYLEKAGIPTSFRW